MKGPFLTGRTAPLCVHQAFRDPELALGTGGRLEEEGSLQAPGKAEALPGREGVCVGESEGRAGSREKLQGAPPSL